MKLPLFLRTLMLATAWAALAATALPSRAAGWPEKPISLVVGFAPGGSADTIARVLAQELGTRLGQQVIIENRSGAGGNIATQSVIDAPADGYTLLFAAINLATNPALLKVKYDTERDLRMVSQITGVPVVMLVPANSPWRTPADVVTAARKTAGGLKVGSGGNGTSSHLAAEIFFRGIPAPFLHVPYRGGAPANQALMGGEIDLMFDLMSGSLKSLVDSGKVRAIGVMQEKRVAALPAVPSAKEAGLPSSAYIRSWQGIAVKHGTPQPVLDKLHAAIVDALKSPALQARAVNLGSEVVPSASPDEFQQLYRAELARWTALIKSADIKVE